MKIKVHSWGGLGSQLFALSLIFDIRKKFPKRKIQLVHHTSGVTRRLFELETFLEKDVILKLVDDYKPNLAFNRSENFFTKMEKLIRLLKKLLGNLRVFIDIDQNPNLDRIKPWTTIIRGHYATRLISDDFLSYCVGQFRKRSPEVSFHSIVVHYRLGDLLYLSGKSFTAPDHIIREIRKITETAKPIQIVVYSDSVREAERFLTSIKTLSDSIIFSEETTFNVVSNSIRVKHFIGTSSKVSFWIEKLRSHQKVHVDSLD
jgi:hypothetical protein